MIVSKTVSGGAEAVSSLPFQTKCFLPRETVASRMSACQVLGTGLTHHTDPVYVCVGGESAS